MSSFVAIVAVALLFMTGFVVDGGRLLHRYVEAHDLAGNAARAAAQEVERDPGSSTGLYAGETPPRIDEAEAQTRVDEFLADAGYSSAGRVVQVIDTDRVRVEVTLDQSLMMMPPGSQEVSASASATAQRGVEVAG